MLLTDRRYRGFGEVTAADINSWIKMGLDVVETGVDIGLKVDAASKQGGGSRPASSGSSQPAQASQPQTPSGQNVKSLGSTIDTNTALMVGGGVLALGGLVYLFTRRR